MLLLGDVSSRMGDLIGLGSWIDSAGMQNKIQISSDTSSRGCADGQSRHIKRSMAMGRI